MKSIQSSTGTKPEGLTLSESSLLRKLLTEALLGAVRSSAASSGLTAYIVGGALRDAFLGVSFSGDLDLVVTGGVKGFAECLAAKVSGSPFLLDRELGAFRIVIKGESRDKNIDISPLRGGSNIVDDLLERDFTINALALECAASGKVANLEIIDPTGGIEDARSGLLRAVALTIMKADPIRGLRAVRFASGYGLKIAPDTESIIRAGAGLTNSSSPERIRDEIIKIFSLSSTEHALRELSRLGLLNEVFVSATHWADLEGNGGYNLEEHVFKVLREADLFLASFNEGEYKESKGLTRLFGESLSGVGFVAVLKFVAFLHDAGKAATVERSESSGGLTFTDHEVVGAKVVREELTRLRFSKKFTSLVVSVVKNHHRVFSLASLENPTRRARVRFFTSLGVDTALLLLVLALLDARATRGGLDPELEQFVKDMLEFYDETSLSVIDRKPLLSGTDIMKIFKIKQGPRVGQLQETLSVFESRGVVSTKRDAIVMLKRAIEKNSNGAREDCN